MKLGTLGKTRLLDEGVLVALVVDQLDNVGRRRLSDLCCVLIDADWLTFGCQVEEGVVPRPVLEFRESVFNDQLLPHDSHFLVLRIARV